MCSKVVAMCSGRERSFPERLNWNGGQFGIVGPVNHLVGIVCSITDHLYIGMAPH